MYGDGCDNVTNFHLWTDQLSDTILIGVERSAAVQDTVTPKKQTALNELRKKKKQVHWQIR